MSKGNKSYALQDRYPKALESYIAGLKIREEIGDNTGVAASLASIGAVNMLLERFSEAKKLSQDLLA